MREERAKGEGASGTRRAAGGVAGGKGKGRRKKGGRDTGSGGVNGLLRAAGATGGRDAACAAGRMPALHSFLSAETVAAAGGGRCGCRTRAGALRTSLR